MKTRLKEVRKRKNLSTRELSELTKLSISYLCRLEKGIQNPSGETIDKLCTVLNVQINEIFTHDVYEFR